MNNKNTSPTIVFSKEELLEKKRITGFLRTNNIEFTPKKNYYGDYEATIKVRSQTPTKRGEEIIKVLEDKESRNKIDFMFNLLSATTNLSSIQKDKAAEQTPEKVALESLANMGDNQKVYSVEKENINIEEQLLSNAHFLSEKDAPTSLDLSLTESKRGSKANLKGKSSPEKNTSCRITANNASPGKKIKTQEHAQTNTELSTRVSERTTQRNQLKSYSVKDVSYTRGYSSENKMHQKGQIVEDEDDCQRILAIANSLGRLNIEEAPTVSPFKIVTETASSIEEQKEEVNMASKYFCAETPTLGQSIYGRESKSDLMTSVLENTRITTSHQSLKGEGHEGLTSGQDAGLKPCHSKNSSVSSLFTLCGNDMPKEDPFIDSPNTQQATKEGVVEKNIEENSLGIEGSEYLLSAKEGGDSSSRFKQWTDLILQDDFFKQLLVKVQDNTGKSEAESLIMLITMLQQASENENINDVTESSTRLESTPSELAPSNHETKKKELLKNNSTPSHKVTKTKEVPVKPYKPSISTSQSAVKTSNATLLNKSASKKIPMSSEKVNKHNDKLNEQSLSAQKKNQTVTSSKSFQVQLNAESNAKVDSRNEINDTGRFPQSLSFQVFQNALNESELIRRTLDIEETDDPSNLSLCHDKFEEANGISQEGIYDDISSIQYQDKSLDNTRGLFDTLPVFMVSVDDRDKQNKDFEDFSSFEGRKENEAEVEIEEREEDEMEIYKEHTLTEEEIYRNNSEIMKNINNLVHKSAYNSSPTKHNYSLSKMSLRSDIINKSHISNHNLTTTEFTNTKTSASSMLENQKGKAERRRHTREIYNELSRRSFQGSITHVSDKQEKLGAKESQDVSTEGMTQYFKLLLAKKNFQNIEQYRKKPKGEASLLLY